MFENDIFLHDNFAQAEVRLAHGLLGLLNYPPLHARLVDYFGLPGEAVIFPPRTGDYGLRPDWKAAHAASGDVLMAIEIERDRDHRQIEDYRAHLTVPVLALWGRADAGGDFSLERLDDLLAEVNGEAPPQVQAHITLVRGLITEAVTGTKHRSKIAPVSDAMRRTPFVQGFVAALGTSLTFDIARPISAGMLRAHGGSPGGFALHVRSRATKRSVGLCNITAGRPFVYFPSARKLKHHLPNRSASVDGLVAFVEALGGEMNEIEFDDKARVDIELAVQHTGELASLALALA